jgi:hypothetical protein
MREECRLRVFKNRVLRWISGPKRDEVTGEWRRLHNKELYALYYSPNIIRVIKSRKRLISHFFLVTITVTGSLTVGCNRNSVLNIINYCYIKSLRSAKRLTFAFHRRQK